VRDKENFFKQIGSVPEGIGYGQFSLSHMIILGITLILSVAVIFVYKASTPETRSMIRILIAVALLLTDVIKYSIIIITHGDLKNYLPLEICSLAEYCILFDSLQKTNTFVTEMLLIVFLPAAIMALIFPTTITLPLCNFFTIHQFAYHGLIVAYVLSRFFAGEINMSYKGVWLSILTTFIIAMIVYVIDRKNNTNFMFLIHDEKNAMLQKISGLCGEGVRYTAGLIFTCIIGIHISYFLFKILEMIFLK
jgi:hypothetical integral membrane protein (TIGR02206 family)